MPADTLNPPRTSQPAAALHAEPPPSLPTMTANTVRMTMAEWKRIHPDFKGSHIGPDGKRWRSVLRPSGMVAVEIIR